MNRCRHSLLPIRPETSCVEVTWFESTLQKLASYGTKIKWFKFESEFDYNFISYQNRLITG